MIVIVIFLLKPWKQNFMLQLLLIISLTLWRSVTLQWLYNVVDGRMVAVNNLSCFLIASSQKQKLVNIYGGLYPQTKFYLQSFILITPQISEPSYKIRIQLWERKLWGQNWLERSLTNVFSQQQLYCNSQVLDVDSITWHISMEIIKEKIKSGYNNELFVNSPSIIILS